MTTETTLGLLVGNRGFFPAHLVKKGREEILAVLAEEGLKAVALTPEDTPFGSVESRQDVHKCAELFKKNAGQIDGILVTLPNFGDERGVAETIRMANLDVPVLVHAFPDEPARMSVTDRRDSFCGKLSVCNNLRQYGLKYSLTSQHTMAPDSTAFQADLQWFAGVCRVVKGLRTARIGAIGARPAPFNTVRYSEKLLENNGIAVEVIDLSEILGGIERLDDGAAVVQGKLAGIRDYVSCEGIPEASLIKMAKLAVVVDEWMAENELVASAIQCWTAIEELLGIVPCTVMSMMSDQLLPSACEVDITGAVGMYALTLASGRPSAILDWNNNYGDDPDKCVLFHCSNLPKAVFAEVRMSQQYILAGAVGLENTYGTCVGRIKNGPFSFARVSTDDLAGNIAAYVGEGEFTDDPLDTFGGVGVARVENLQGLLRHICNRGFEHHVAITHATVASALNEAMSNYLGWDVYAHNG